MSRSNPDTGKVTILRYTAIQDVGTAVHPAYVEGQMQGGAVQGIGWALNEEYYYDDNGRMANSSFLDYRMPTTLDVPMIDTIIVEVPNPAPSVRRPWRRRTADRPAPRRHRQCHRPCDRRPPVHNSRCRHGGFSRPHATWSKAINGHRPHRCSISR